MSQVEHIAERLEFFAAVTRSDEEGLLDVNDAEVMERAAALLRGVAAKCIANHAGCAALLRSDMP